MQHQVHHQAHLLVNHQFHHLMNYVVYFCDIRCTFNCTIKHTLKGIYFFPSALSCTSPCVLKRTTVTSHFNGPDFATVCTFKCTFKSIFLGSYLGFCFKYIIYWTLKRTMIFTHTCIIYSAGIQLYTCIE